MAWKGHFSFALQSAGRSLFPQIDLSAFAVIAWRRRLNVMLGGKNFLPMQQCMCPGTLLNLDFSH